MRISSKHLIIRGIVQGVGFRMNTLREAARIGGLLGWVRNLDDGAVEVRVQGSPDAVDTLVRWCAHGPRSARVDQVVETEVPQDLSLPAFTVK